MSKTATRSRTKLISVHECAVALEVSDATIYALVESGKWLGSVKVGRTYIISRRAFQRHYDTGDVFHDEPSAFRPFLVRRVA
ncbi:MAG: excisionase family DNA-binding protein [Thermomicrobiales bacterium]